MKETEFSELCAKINRDCESIRLASKIIIGEYVVIFWFILPVIAYHLR